jgi:2-keto-3-deoxy-L-rhamnonate aldolase RhmA
VEDIEGIASVECGDSIFIGPADLSVDYGYNHQTSEELFAAFERCAVAAKANGKTYMSWLANDAKAKEWSKYGMNMFLVGSEHSWMLRGANVDAAGVHEI